jgi:predicted ATPase
VIHEALEKVYAEFGIELLAVPFMPIQERAAFIINETTARVPTRR